MKEVTDILVNENTLYPFIAGKLRSHKPVVHKYADVPYREAAVLVPLFFKNGEAHLLFTKRTEKVETHKGQISFPGGMKDPGDRDLAMTALRETREEMGIQSRDISLLGQTDVFLTNTDFLVTPYVGYYPFPYDYKINHDEISKILEVPLSHLLNPEIFETREIKRNGYTWNVHYYYFGDELIWGVTGFLLSNFLKIVFGYRRDTPEVVLD